MNDTIQWTQAEQHEIDTAHVQAQHGVPALIIDEFKAALFVWRYYNLEDARHEANLWATIAKIYEVEILRRLESIKS
jgi:hypothetical protein